MPPQKKKSSTIGKIIMAVLVAGALVMVVTAVVAKHGLLTYVEMNKRYEIMQEELKDIKEENVRLKNEISALKTDPETIERVAREKLGMIKPGEVLYRLNKEPSAVEEGGAP